MRFTSVIIGLTLCVMPWLAGCGSNDNSPTEITGIGAPGAVRMIIADAPLETLHDVAQVNVTITKVDLLYDGREDSLQTVDPDAEGNLIRPAHLDESATTEDSNDRVVTLFTGERSVDLLSLANKTMEELTQLALLSEVQIPSGHYKRVRVTMSTTGTVVTSDETTVELRIPSGHIDMPLNLFVSPGETEIVLADFVVRGNLHPPTEGHNWYILTPGLRMSKMKHLAELHGNLLLPSLLPHAASAVVALYDAQNEQAILDAQGQPIETTLQFGDQLRGLIGRFTLLGVANGSYTLRITVTAGEHSQTITRPITILQHAHAIVPDDIPVALPVTP